MTIVMANYYDEGDVNELKFNRSTFPSHRLFAILSLTHSFLYTTFLSHIITYCWPMIISINSQLLMRKTTTNDNVDDVRRKIKTGRESNMRAQKLSAIANWWLTGAQCNKRYWRLQSFQTFICNYKFFRCQQFVWLRVSPPCKCIDLTGRHWLTSY